MKRCKHCGETKPIDEFYGDRKARDGCRPECKACNLAARARKYAADPQPYVDRVKKWQQENPERLNEYRREYRRRPERKVADRAGTSSVNTGSRSPTTTACSKSRAECARSVSNLGRRSARFTSIMITSRA